MFCNINNFSDSESTDQLTIEKELDNFANAIRGKTLIIPFGIKNEKSSKLFEILKEQYYLNDQTRSQIIKKLEEIKSKIGGPEIVTRIINHLWFKLSTI